MVIIVLYLFKENKWKGIGKHEIEKEQEKNLRRQSEKSPSQSKM